MKVKEYMSKQLSKYSVENKYWELFTKMELDKDTYYETKEAYNNKLPVSVVNNYFKEKSLKRIEDARIQMEKSIQDFETYRESEI